MMVFMGLLDGKMLWGFNWGDTLIVTGGPWSAAPILAWDLGWGPGLLAGGIAGLFELLPPTEEGAERGRIARCRAVWERAGGRPPEHSTIRRSDSTIR